jgi:malonyl-CoA O-methyltransferase
MKWWPFKKEMKILSPLEGYNLWASTYHTESNPIKNLSDDFIKKHLPHLKEKSVMDAGCGTGKFCSIAEQQGASKILGLDLSPVMIDVAKTNCRITKFTCGDLSSATLEENNFDIIICALVLGHIENLTPALDHLLKALKNGGALIITDFHPFLTLLQSKRTFQDQRSGKHFEVRHHLHLFQSYFTILHEHAAVVEMLEEPIFNNTPVIFGMVIRKK